MFSLFTKKKHPAAELYKHYSEDEKFTILSVLFLAGTCDNDQVNRSRINAELAFLNEVVDMFEVKARNSQEYLDRHGPENVLKHLKSFDRSKQNISLVMMMEMLQCDGPLNEEEVLFIGGVLERLEISVDDFKKQMDKNLKLYNLFMKD